jgi:hypothetical protein
MPDIAAPDAVDSADLEVVDDILYGPGEGDGGINFRKVEPAVEPAPVVVPPVIPAAPVAQPVVAPAATAPTPPPVSEVPAVIPPIHLQVTAPVAAPVAEPAALVVPTAPVVEPPVVAPTPAPVAEPAIPPVSDRYRVKDWPDEDQAAMAYKARNKDVPLDKCLEIVRGLRAAENPAPAAPAIPQAPARSSAEIATEIATIETKLKEAGTTEGLYNAEIADLNIALARLQPQLIDTQRQEQEHIAAYNRQLQSAWETSEAEAFKLYPDAQDTESEFGQAVAAMLSELSAGNAPILNEPNAPMAVIQLVAARRGVAPKISAPAGETPSVPVVQVPVPGSVVPPVAPPLAADQPRIVQLPSGASSTAQPHVITLAEAQRFVGETDDLDTLDGALFGNGTPKPMIR